MMEAEADKPKVVIEYRGLQIRDARDHIQLHFTSMPPPRGVKWCMKDAGFKSSNGGRTWIKPNTPDAIFTAQSIGNTFFTQEKP